MLLGFSSIGYYPIAGVEDEPAAIAPIDPEAPTSVIVETFYNYVGIAKSRLTSEFDNSTKLQNLMGAIVAPLMQAEQVCNDLMDERWIASAIGKQLDGCGYIVGVNRNGMNDDDYRQAIYHKIMINLSLATPPDLIKIIKAITLPWVCQYYEMRSAFCCLYTDGLGKYVPKNIQTTIQQASPGGIETVPVCVGYKTDSLRFSYDSSLVISGKGALAGRDDKAYITGDEANIILSTTSKVDNVSLMTGGLGGLAPPDAWINNHSYLVTDTGDIIVFNAPEESIPYGGQIVCGVF